MTTPPGAGVVDYAGLAIAYDARVLEPRPWTSMQSRWAAELLAEHAGSRHDDGAVPLLELCCGAGHIGLLAATLASCRWVAVDVDATACAYTASNADAAGAGERVDVRHARLEEALGDDERFAVVVADPPWVRRDRIGDFPEDPVLAIDGGADGLDVARAIIAVCADHVVRGGSVLLQLGHASQVESLRDELEDAWRADEVRTGERGLVVRLQRR